MGADIYNESHRWSPRAPWAKATKFGNLSIYVDRFYSGYRRAGSVKDTPEVRSLCKLLDIQIVDKPL